MVLTNNNTDAGSDEEICEGGIANLTASGGQSFVWDNGGGSGASISVSPSSTTTYTVTATDANGCEGTDEVEVVVNTNPVADAGVDDEICIGASVTLTASGGGDYLWNTGDNTASITETPSSAGTENYIVTVTDGNGCTHVDDVDVIVNENTTASAGSDEDICLGETINLNAMGGAPYTWDHGPTTAAITISPTTTTTYIVTATDGNGCTGSAEVTVTVNENSNASAGQDVNICEGESVTLMASGGVDFDWDNGPNTADYTVTPLSDTDYEVTVTDNNDCTGTDEVTVFVEDAPDVGLTALPSPICVGDDLILTETEVEGNTWEWAGPNFSTTNNNPTVTVTNLMSSDFGDYFVTVTDNNGCSSTASILIVQGTCVCPDPGTCDDGDCTNGEEIWDDVNCQCMSINVPDPNTCIDDGDCTNGDETWDATTCMCIQTNVPDPTTCIDDGDCSNGDETWDATRCMCIQTNVPDPTTCIDDGDCSNGDETWDATTCMCTQTNVPDPTTCVDDGDCANGLETWNPTTCNCDIISTTLGCTNNSCLLYTSPSPRDRG